MSKEDIIEDITEEALLEDQELVQDTSAEEVTEQQSYSDAIKSVLLGESKASKKESESEEDEDEEEDEEDDMEEGYKKKTETKSEEEDEESEKEDEDEEEMEEAAPKPTASGSATDAVVVKDAEAEAATTAAEIKKSEPKAATTPKGTGKAASVKTPDEADSVKSVDKAAKTSPKSTTEDLDILISSEANLTEDFKAKASTLFEAAVSQKVVAERERLQEEHAQNLVEEVTEIRESLINKIDDYLNYVVESFVEENQVAVDSKLRTEIAEDFMGSLKDLFVESYIEVPEAKTDLFDELEKETLEVKESLEIASSEVYDLSEKVEELTRAKILAEQTKDLASTQVEKMRSLTEEVEFVSEEAFAEKVATIKGSVFKSSSKSEDIVEDVDSETEVIVEGESGITNEHVSNDMKKYLSALTRIKENNPNGK
jgi:hypothetical protein|tara:strand:- start:1447 stop:2730 length:1284 start_codon:yes stop_codon:yes gene_type:complete